MWRLCLSTPSSVQQRSKERGVTWGVWGRWRMSQLLVLMFAFLALLSGCAREQLIRQESFVFGTRVEVLVYGKTAEQAHEAAAEVLREFDRLHRTYHAWRPSRLTELNEAIAAGRPLEVSAELSDLIVTAQRVAADGDYLFDPGIGRLIGLWGFQNDEFKPQLPEAAALLQWRAAHPSIADLTVTDRRVASRNPAVALDFGGYLKGVALDRAARLLRSRGIQDALINIGGNVMALGSKGGQPWRVGIQHPRSNAPLASLELQDGEAIGTSGDYQRFFEFEGRRYCHLIDPRSAAPATDTQAVTILIPSSPEAGMRSDALSKPLFIAGRAWPAMAGRLGVNQVLRVDADGQVQVTDEMRRRLRFEVASPDMVTAEVRMLQKPPSELNRKIKP
jgi:thiamine biosynthesis lipoprotein